MKTPHKIEQSTTFPEALKHPNFSPRPLLEDMTTETTSLTLNVDLYDSPEVTAEYNVNNGTNIEMDPDYYEDSNIELI